MSNQSDTTYGWAVHEPGTKLIWTKVELKPFTDNDIDLQITHCGICGSDLHTIKQEWGPLKYTPLIPGHEISGIVKRVGKNVSHLKIGDRAAIGAQSGSNCHFTCQECKNGFENICEKGMLDTYNDYWSIENKKYPTHGGYSQFWRGDGHFVVKIPDSMSNEQAASFMCAGVTTYAPLKRFNVSKGDQVGVIGLGGLGHYAIQWIKALGAKPIVLSHSLEKKQDALKLGAHEFILTSNLNELKNYQRSLTHIICTSFHTPFNWDLWFNLLKSNSTFILLSLPNEKLSGISAMKLISKQIKLVGSLIGSIQEIKECLDLAVNENIQTWIEKFPMKDAQIAIDKMLDGKARYRIILENENENGNGNGNGNENDQDFDTSEGNMTKKKSRGENLPTTSRI